jgi:hypothetical protein
MKKEFDLNEIAGGALNEKFADAFAKILQNLSDPNTPYKDKRTIDMKLDFTQNEDRNDVICSISVKTKLAATQPVKTGFGVFKDLRDGTISVEEYGSQMRGQTMLPDHNEDNVVPMKKVN